MVALVAWGQCLQRNRRWENRKSAPFRQKLTLCLPPSPPLPSNSLLRSAPPKRCCTDECRAGRTKLLGSLVRKIHPFSPLFLLQPLDPALPSLPLPPAVWGWGLVSVLLRWERAASRGGRQRLSSPPSAWRSCQDSPGLGSGRNRRSPGSGGRKLLRRAQILKSPRARGFTSQRGPSRPSAPWTAAPSPGPPPPTAPIPTRSLQVAPQHRTPVPGSTSPTWMATCPTRAVRTARRWAGATACALRPAALPRSRPSPSWPSTPSCAWWVSSGTSWSCMWLSGKKGVWPPNGAFSG